MTKSTQITDHRTEMSVEEKEAAGDSGQVQLTMSETSKPDEVEFFDTVAEAEAAAEKWIAETETT